MRIGRVLDEATGERTFVVNPTYAEQERSDLELTIAGTADYISMVEAGAHEISEEDMLDAMTFGQEAIAAFCEKQKAFPRQGRSDPDGLHHPRRRSFHRDACRPLLRPDGRRPQRRRQALRMGKVEDLKAQVKENEFSDEERAAWGSDIAAALKALEKRAMRKMIIETASAPTVVRPRRFARSTSLPAICRAFMAADCSSAVRRRS